MISRFGRLAPRRRMFVMALGLVAVSGAATIGVTAFSGSVSTDSPAGYPAQNRPGPVLLVPGYGGSTTALEMLASQIRATGRTARVVRLPGNGTGSLIRDAAVLNSAVASVLTGGAPSVDVIGYSAGGVVTLLWARDDGGAHKARRVITLGSPFHGAAIAATAVGVLPDACPLACQQLVPGSSLLAGLAAGAPDRLPWLSLWTTDDETVTPPDSARLPGAIDVPIQSVCPQERISHSQLPVNPAVTALVLRAIGPGLLRHPVPADCRP